jgi:4-amino-4-deoxy-L-arabinose transferase-like glycosyltransferase
VISAFRYPEKYLMWATLAAAVLSGFGFSGLQAWARVHGGLPARGRFLHISAWSLLGVALLALAVVRPGVVMAIPALALTLVTVLALLRAARGSGAWLAFALGVSLLGAWYIEQPVTRRYDPLQVPLTLEPVEAAGLAHGRVLRDPSVQSVPLPPGFERLRPSERQSIFYRETWTFNSPRLWGCATAGGFSPAESAAMRGLRMRLAVPGADAIPAAADLAQFCRWSAVEWILTTPARLAALRDAGLPAARYSGWGEPAAVIVARVEQPSWVEAWDGASARVVDLWRPRDGFIRIDLEPGGSGWLRLADTYGQGWQAMDQRGNDLRTDRLAGAFLGVEAQPDTRQIRLHYEPVLWGAAWRLSAAGLVLGLGLLAWVRRPTLRGDLRRPFAPIAMAVIIATALGLSARSRWAVTFDEGFHLARGIGWRVLHDSRLSYFHPPLQNAAAGYFSALAWGDQLDAAPDAPGWRDAEVQSYSAEFAARNRDRFPDAVQAARWGSLLFYLLLCAAGVYGAHVWGGSLAAWLAAAGLALQPSLLVHGNLATTDIGVAAFAVLGTLLLARGLQHGRADLAGAMVAFVLAAVTKHSGLIWLGALLLVVVPALALRQRKPRLLALLPVAVAVLGGALLLLYGPSVQPIRYGPGGAWPAGRFIEGLFRQGGHALEGHRAFLAGHVFQQGSWWHAPLTLLLKTPEVWSVAALWSLTLLLSRRRSPVLLALVPAIAFAGLLMFAGKLSLGVRHLLPLLALGVIGGAVAVARLRRATVRMTAATALVAGSLLSATVWPHYLSYVPAWAGGLDDGAGWVLDSNYDWGQDATTLEENWGGLVDANAGVPPTLYYFGFMDPAHIYRLRVGPGSYLGFMKRGQGVTNAPPADRVTVASVSALGLNPHGYPLSAVTNGLPVGELGPTYRLFSAR